MNKEEIYEMVVREITEVAVRERNEHSSEAQDMRNKVCRLSKQMQEKIKDLPKDVKTTITEYIETALLEADQNCMYLYVQGAKDCVELLIELSLL